MKPADDNVIEKGLKNKWRWIISDVAAAGVITQHLASRRVNIIIQN